MVSRESLAAVLRLARAARGLSRDKLYDQARIEPRNLQNLENARSGVTLEMLEKVAAGLGFNPIALLIAASSYDAQHSVSQSLKALDRELEQMGSLGIIEAIPKHFSEGKLVPEQAGKRTSTEKVQQAIRYRDEGLSQKETASKLGLSVATVSRIWRNTKTQSLR